MGYLHDILSADSNAEGGSVLKNWPPPQSPWMAHAMLELAQIEYPGLDPRPYLTQLNEISSHLGDRLRNFNDGREFVEKAAEYLFGELGFRGNETNFYDPDNSCLNQVLDRKVGIPITLSLVYVLVASRLKMPVYGVALPRRFVVRYDDGNYSTYIDPYGGGQRVSIGECLRMAGLETADLSIFIPATPKRILMRMLENLQGCYLRRNDFERAIQVLNWLLIGDPDQPQRYKLRGVIHLELHHWSAARRDLEQYLHLAPENSPDKPELREQLAEIHAQLGRIN